VNTLAQRCDQGSVYCVTKCHSHVVGKGTGRTNLEDALERVARLALDVEVVEARRIDLRHRDAAPLLEAALRQLHTVNGQFENSPNLPGASPSTGRSVQLITRRHSGFGSHPRGSRPDDSIDIVTKISGVDEIRSPPRLR
jgi:hypothetical protein